MSILFGFAGRLGRLNYFLLTCALAVLMTLLVFVLISALMPHYAAADGKMPTEPPSGMVLSIAAIVMPVFLWFSLALQAKRFRDIGWRPLYVILGWIAAIVVDMCLAALIPSLAIGEGTQTMAGVVINLAMVGCLLFWPGAPAYGDDSGPRFIAPDRPASGMPPAPAVVGAKRNSAAMGFGRRVA